MHTTGEGAESMGIDGINAGVMAEMIGLFILAVDETIPLLRQPMLDRTVQPLGRSIRIDIDGFIPIADVGLFPTKMRVLPVVLPTTHTMCSMRRTPNGLGGGALLGGAHTLRAGGLLGVGHLHGLLHDLLLAV